MGRQEKKIAKKKTILDLDPDEEAASAAAQWKKTKAKVMTLGRLKVVGDNAKQTMSADEIEAMEAQERAEKLEREGRCKFRVVKAVNGFHPDQVDNLFPSCAGILLLVSMSWQPKEGGIPIEQLVEVELLGTTTTDARWLADFTKMTPAADTPPAWMLTRSGSTGSMWGATSPLPD